MFTTVGGQPSLPERLKALRYENLFKPDKWWSAVILLGSFGRRRVALYLWSRRGVSKTTCYAVKLKWPG